MKEEQIKELKSLFPKEAYGIDKSRGFPLTTIDAYYIIERLNKVFGMCGEGWGLKIKEYIRTETEITALSVFWYKNGDEIMEIQCEGGKRIVKTNITDAYKSARTNAICKGASFIGVGMNVYKGEYKDNYSGENGEKKNFAGENSPRQQLKAILLENFPTENEKDKTAKKKLLNFVFNTYIWNDIITYNDEKLNKGIKKIKRMLENLTVIEMLLGNQDGNIFDPAEESISTDGKIDEPINEWTTNFKKIQKLKKHLPEAEYRSILYLTIPKKSYKKSNEIKKLEHQQKIISVLETRVKELNPES